MEIKINEENKGAEKIEVSVSKIYEKKSKDSIVAKIDSHVGREVGEELIVEENKKKNEKKPIEEIKELLVPLAVHEAKSAFYKLKIAKVVALEGGKIAVKGAKIAANGAKVAGEKIQIMSENHKRNKKEKGGKNEKTKGENN